jgi:hypothetical protein
MHRESLQHRRWAGVKEAQDQEREVHIERGNGSHIKELI